VKTLQKVAFQLRSLLLHLFLPWLPCFPLSSIPALLGPWANCLSQAWHSCVCCSSICNPFPFLCLVNSSDPLFQETWINLDVTFSRMLWPTLPRWVYYFSICSFHSKRECEGVILTMGGWEPFISFWSPFPSWDYPCVFICTYLHVFISEVNGFLCYSM
jgi:hypothetical protein